MIKGQGFMNYMTVVIFIQKNIFRYFSFRCLTLKYQIFETNYPGDADTLLFLFFAAHSIQLFQSIPLMTCAITQHFKTILFLYTICIFIY